MREDRTPMVLIANGVDCKASERKVSQQDGKDMATELECPYFETVAVSSNNKQVLVNHLSVPNTDIGSRKSGSEAFLELLRQIHLVVKHKEEGNTTSKPPVTQLVKEARHGRLFRYSRMDSEEIKFSNKDASGQFFTCSCSSSL